MNIGREAARRVALFPVDELVGADVCGSPLLDEEAIHQRAQELGDEPLDLVLAPGAPRAGPCPPFQRCRGRAKRCAGKIMRGLAIRDSRVGRRA